LAEDFFAVVDGPSNSTSLTAGLVSCLFVVVYASSSSNAASIFNLPLQQNSANYTFALNIPDDSTDIYLHLSGPADYSWIAVGTGAGMQSSHMIIIYSNADGTNVTVSPRIAFGEKEPVFSSSTSLDLLAGTGIVNNTMTLNARCNDCTQWADRPFEAGIPFKGGGPFKASRSFDSTSTSQPWIFGLGPVGSTSARMRSNSKTANIERHSKYGVFIMNMTHATGGTGGLPTSYANAAGSSSTGEITNDKNLPSIIHAVFVCVAIILLMPTGVVYLRLSPRSVRWHWVNQTLSSILAIIGIIVGFYLSHLFTKSQSHHSAHQIIGTLILLAILAQLVMGVWHHLSYKRIQLPTIFGKIHRYLGYVIMFAAIVNGGIGLYWSNASHAVMIGYSIIVAIIGLGLIAVFGLVAWQSKKESKGYTRDHYELRGVQITLSSNEHMGSSKSLDKSF
ncbi:hypothetical protein N7495_006231, partial [Penicillium taxi]|uniref:uncharacterized protein n=1 Tax=Penicillium taxi TaxID=168475 RepID=UPI00254510FC